MRQSCIHFEILGGWTLANQDDFRHLELFPSLRTVAVAFCADFMQMIFKLVFISSFRSNNNGNPRAVMKRVLNNFE